jgi:hypothetical protein
MEYTEYTEKCRRRRKAIGFSFSLSTAIICPNNYSVFSDFLTVSVPVFSDLNSYIFFYYIPLWI